MPLSLGQSLNLGDFLRKRRQDAASAGRHQNIVFNPDSDLFIREIDARLDGDHHIGFESSRCIANVMNLEADVMARTVYEISFVTLRADVAVCGLMDVADSDARFDPGYCRFLSVEDDLINLSLPRRKLARNRIRAGHIRAVAAILGP